MSIGAVHSSGSDGKLAIVDGWLCKIYSNGYAECSLYMRVYSTLSGWSTTLGGFRYGTWGGVTLPGTLNISDRQNKPFNFTFCGASADAYVTSFMLHTNGTSLKTPSVTGYTIYTTSSSIAVDLNWYVQGFFDFTGKEIKWL